MVKKLYEYEKVIYFESNDKRGGNRKKMKKIKAVWDKVSYEMVIIVVFLMQFIMERATDLQEWSSAWNAMDYSMGTGSRLLMGSIYRLFYGDYLDNTVAYKYVAIGIGITIIVLAITLGKLIRKAVDARPDCRNIIIWTVVAYVASPWSIAYVWNTQNFGRFDVYMLLVGVLAVFVALTVENVYLKFFLYTSLGVLGLAIHQGFAFLFYPMILIVMCYDVFKDNQVQVKNLALAVISGLVNVAVAIYFQFFSSLRFDSVEEIVADIASRSNIYVSDWALYIEYFGGMKYQLEEITPGFFRDEAPWTKMVLIFLLFAPVLIVYVLIWKDVFSYLKENKIKILQSSYLYMLLVHLCYVPMFLIHTDWGRHFAPWFTLQTFIFLFYLAKKDSAMTYAYEKMKIRAERHPWYFVLAVVWIATFDSFGARNPFQTETQALYEFLKDGFFK